MSTKTIRICDGCGKELTKTSEAYKLSLRTDRFWDGTEMDYLTQQLDFCYGCAKDIKEALIRIAGQK